MKHHEPKRGLVEITNKKRGNFRHSYPEESLQRLNQLGHVPGYLGVHPNQLRPAECSPANRVKIFRDFSGIIELVKQICLLGSLEEFKEVDELVKASFCLWIKNDDYRRIFKEDKENLSKNERGKFRISPSSQNSNSPRTGVQFFNGNMVDNDGFQIPNVKKVFE